MIFISCNTSKNSSNSTHFISLENHKLETFAQILFVNKKTKVFTIDYSKIASPINEKEILDSIYRLRKIRFDKNGAKHEILIHWLKNLEKHKHELHVSDFKRLIGETTLKSGKLNGESLFYCFNNYYSPDCYNINYDPNFYDNCSSLLFKFDRDGYLQEVYTEAFGY